MITKERRGKLYNILIKNIGNTKSYLSLCLDNPRNINNYAIVTKVYFYNNINDALNNGRWIIIPNFNNGRGLSINGNNYNFYEDWEFVILNQISVFFKSLKINKNLLRTSLDDDYHNLKYLFKNT